MKKHLFGLALFSFIVGATAFICSMFGIGSVRKLVPVERVYTTADYSDYAQSRSCWKMRREASGAHLGSPTVKQAIFNIATKQLKWELDASKIDAPIALNFFVKDENGTRYVNSLFVPLLAYQDKGSVQATSSPKWLDDLDSYENLYVTAEPISLGAYRNKNFPVEFDADKATAVLIY